MIDDGLILLDRLLPWLSPEVRITVGLPLLVVLLWLLVTAALRVVVSLEQLLRPLWMGTVTLVGLLAVLPEYLCTTVLRRLRRRPPGAVYLYDEAVERLVEVGQRIGQVGLSGLTTDRRLRRVVVMLVVGMMLVVGNSQTCTEAPQVDCRTPVSAWWNQVSGNAGQITPPPSVPAD